MSEPNKVPVFVVPAGTWMPIVGETEAIDLLSPFRVVAERDYAKLAQALTLATQRAEAAEAERDRLADDRARFPGRPDDVGRMIEARRGSLEDGIKSANAYAREAINRAEKAEAEREALRKVDDAMVERALVAWFDEPGCPEEINSWGKVQKDSVDGGAALRVFMRDALDAALAVQP